jgi:hypothetical protein
MSDQIVYLSVRGPRRRALTLIPLLLALAGAWFSVRWYVANTIAQNLNPDDRGIETARIAAGLGPGDALTHWTLAEVQQRRLPPDQANQSIREYEQAVRLAPNDYRFWLALGRALEQSGDTEKAEKAMSRAVELAPAYAYPRWYLGNLLLRGGHDSEAFAELLRASGADPQLRVPVFNLAWEVYGKNPAELNKAIGATAGARAEFAKYLVDRQKIDDGLRLWDTLTAQEKQDNRATGEFLIKSVYEAKRFRKALEIWNDLASGEAARGQVGQLFNGGFEQNTGSTSSGVFGWQVKSAPQAQVAVDPANAHSGGRSLRLLFQAPAKIDINVSQLVVVEPDTQYDLEYFLKTKKLESAGTPLIEILDAMDGAVLASSQPAPAGDNDWQRNSLAFKTGAKAEAIVVRLIRASCGDNSVCPIFGTVWYDDFDLKRRS